jgi:hypothetical protein
MTEFLTFVAIVLTATTVGVTIMVTIMYIGRDK